LPGGKSLSFVSPKESNPRKGDPDIPETPKLKRAGRAAKNSPRFCWADLIFVSGAQTPLPLIHPTHSIFGGAVRGGKSKPAGLGWLFGLPRICADRRRTGKCLANEA
jgi:hypothetical protein